MSCRKRGAISLPFSFCTPSRHVRSPETQIRRLHMRYKMKGFEGTEGRKIDSSSSRYYQIPELVLYQIELSIRRHSTIIPQDDGGTGALSQPINSPHVGSTSLRVDSRRTLPPTTESCFPLPVLARSSRGLSLQLVVGRRDRHRSLPSCQRARTNDRQPAQQWKTAPARIVAPLLAQAKRRGTK